VHVLVRLGAKLSSRRMMLDAIRGAGGDWPGPGPDQSSFDLTDTLTDSGLAIPTFRWHPGLCMYPLGRSVRPHRLDCLMAMKIGHVYEDHDIL